MITITRDEMIFDEDESVHQKARAKSIQIVIRQYVAICEFNLKLTPHVEIVLSPRGMAWLQFGKDAPMRMTPRACISILQKLIDAIEYSMVIREV